MLVRHAKAQGRGPHSGLSDLGERQSLALASALDNIHYKPKLIISASNLASVQTAEIIAEFFKINKEFIRIDKRFDPVPFELFERNFEHENGSSNSVSFINCDEEAEDQFIRRALSSWQLHSKSFKIIAPAEYIEGVQDGLLNLEAELSKSSEILVVAAAGAIESALHCILQNRLTDVFGGLGIDISHAGITELHFSSSNPKIRVAGFNQNLHLQHLNLESIR